MKNESQKEETLHTLDEEETILKRFRSIPSSRIVYSGRFFHCFRIERLIKSVFFSRSWIDSSSKSDLPPDFHNDKHRVMMEMMRIDDAEQRFPNSFQRTNTYLEKHFGKGYKKEMNGSELFFIPNTRNDKEYNFKGYFRNFERVLTKHSDKVDEYHQHYPKCKTCILFICDESNAYYQAVDNSEKIIIHICFKDEKFVKIIKGCNADYVVWFTLYKTIFRDNGKEIKLPYAFIYDVKHLKQTDISYDHSKMVKIQ